MDNSWPRKNRDFKHYAEQHRETHDTVAVTRLALERRPAVPEAGVTVRASRGSSAIVLSGDLP
jgi:hypothetical protein